MTTIDWQRLGRLAAEGALEPLSLQRAQEAVIRATLSMSDDGDLVEALLQTERAVYRDEVAAGAAEPQRAMALSGDGTVEVLLAVYADGYRAADPDADEAAIEAHREWPAVLPTTWDYPLGLLSLIGHALGYRDGTSARMLRAQARRGQP